jgi:hypothetical protein
METELEIAKLREEIQTLRRQVAIIRSKIGLYEEEEGDSGYLSTEVESLSVRVNSQQIPVILHADENGGSILLRDKKHVARIELEANDTAGVIQLRNAAGNVIVMLGEAEDGSGMVFVFDKEGKPGPGLRTNQFGGVVTATAETGATRACLQAAPEGGRVLVTDDEGRPAAKLHGDEKGGTVVVTETSGTPMAFMTSFSGHGSVGVKSEVGDEAVAISSDESGGVIALYDSEGKIRKFLQ